MVDIELSFTSAVELARRYRSGELSPVEVVRNSLERIAEVNPRLNCFAFVFADEARARASQLEAAFRRGEDPGPLAGIPIAFKDLTPTAGKRTTMGSYAYEHWVPETSALLVGRLLGAGAVMVGKTTTPEFAYSSFTESPLWGATRNPWDLERSPGGSSGGSAAAVASGCVPLAEGTDMGGSVRIPASWSGVVGLKPTFGRLPLDFIATQFDTIQHFGPLARTIDDARLFLACGQGADDRDAMSLPAIDLAGPLARDAHGLRLALSIDLGCHAVDPAVEAQVRAAAAALAAAGAEVEEVEIGWTRALPDAWEAHWNVYLAAFFGHALDTHRAQMDPVLVAMMDEGLQLSAVDFKRLEIIRTDAWKQLAVVLADHHALLSPTMSQPARLISRADADTYAERGDGIFRAIDMTTQFNYASQCPTLSAPAGFTPDGLPVGLQIAARRYDDDLALRIGAALETARPWAQARPPI